MAAQLRPPARQNQRELKSTQEVFTEIKHAGSRAAFRRCHYRLASGATETEFARTSGMETTELFKTTASDRSVAEDGYDAMLESKLDVISGVTFTQRMMLAAIPFAPKQLLLSQNRKTQETKPLVAKCRNLVYRANPHAPLCLSHDR